MTDSAPTTAAAPGLAMLGSGEALACTDETCLVTSSPVEPSAREADQREP
jgi:hypothetical protein